VIWIQPILKKRKKNLSVSKSEKNKKQKKWNSIYQSISTQKN
jgi:hypothetical protein